MKKGLDSSLTDHDNGLCSRLPPVLDIYQQVSVRAQHLAGLSNHIHIRHQVDIAQHAETLLDLDGSEPTVYGLAKLLTQLIQGGGAMPTAFSPGVWATGQP